MKESFLIMIKKIINYFKENILFLTFVITSILNEFLLRAFSVKNYFEIKPLVADLAIILIVGSFGYFFKPKNRFKYYFTWGIIFTLVCIINSIYYNNFMSYASFSLLATSLQAASVTDAIIQNVIEIKDFTYVFQLIILLVVNSTLKKKGYFQKIKQNGKVLALNTMVMGVILIGFFISMLTNLDIGRFGKQWNREYVVMKFGTYLYQFNDLFISLKPQISPLFGYDEHAKKFREYYNNKDYSHNDNEYTDIFEGKNIIAIHAESIQQFTMETSFNGIEVTPTLNKLASEGMYFTNFYAQESVGTSSDTEFTFNTSLMPSSSGTVFVNYWDREYLTIPKLLSEKNYYTFSMHGNNGSAWNRDMMYKYIGYDKFYSKKDYEIDEEIGLGLSDKSFFRQSVDKIVEINEQNDNWYGTLIMLTNHTPFSDINDYSDYSVDLNNEDGTVTKYLEGTKMGNYLKSVHYADEAIGDVMSMLDEKGILDDTIVVIYGDHDAKLKTSEFEKLYYNENIDSVLIDPSKKIEVIDDYTYELNRKVPFIIWSKDKIATDYTGTFNKVMGMIDVSPTLENMLGLYNPYALGHDIFSVDENVVVFPGGNWMTNKLYYNASKKEYRQLEPDASISIDYINKYSEYAESIIELSNGIIEYDLIEKVNQGDEQLSTVNK